MAEAGVDIGGSRTAAALHQPRPDQPRSDHARQGRGPVPRPPRAVAGEGTPCDLVTVPARQGLEAVDILRLRDGVGPVLHDGDCRTLGFLVPPGTAAAWDMPGSACTQAYGRGARAGRHEPPVTGTGWLVAPDAAFSEATDPAVLRAALGEAARTIEAVDRCR
ncbi:hypothetical protein [Streptomyces caatingaensis]|uniref:Uncharacterized protein n=1 Tax=Streptomyces caatingaensis TaxID=1678637 RepID=A0A0K9X8I9_9ACTN|nr:hypothetical protein [Streptomyces caatingaensis]KNB49416.1 hypothetical protein AC230_29655 [Streptomyces caatingaensis]